MGTLTLKRRMRALDAFVALAAADLQRIADALRALDRRDRPDDLHALRVAVRHLRAVRWVFAPALPGTVAARWRIVLRDLMRATGPVRDWDVLIADTLQPAVSRQPGDPVLLALLDSAQSRREAARATLMTVLHALRSQTLPVLDDDLAALRHRAVDGIPGKANAPLGRLARRRVRKARRSVRALKARWRELGTEADLALAPAADVLHALRVAGKRLRYAIEAVGPVLPGRYTGRVHRKLVARQARLGAQTDAASARSLLSALLSGPGEEHPFESAGTAGTPIAAASATTAMTAMPPPLSPSKTAQLVTPTPR
ncbi:CHAD domain-containing protein [Cupriavidus gilardii]|uniref:CHAD domain-containing protein n=1 Tax=Cupriavidus gilardii TaxID=82541 RepID=A0A6N1BWY0_9BURK|nr:CHAD domain-containing protein [Cupriavidus gilardii]KAB0594970.1 CHAD domain-containing protein [Cupriavidus gilardii]MCT9013800.1 CHAD domain-containing protein [Cupriavidus gilardii]MCT9051988.1 CHAD domain-containing protein [Cupriavidus gilardii]MCT9073049.1 CHAD domain-containing protein [Cupriavidus gilardii]MCT9126258.1 CHAD domain-containing protein [Cupriavidus gilardii]